MARKPRPEPITQGSLADIYKHFFGKLLIYKPPQMELNDWMETLFHFRERDIIRYEAVTPFKMPGLFCQAPHVKVQGIGYRQVEVGTPIFVRLDLATPNSIDVEFMGGQGGADQVFNLSGDEWRRVARHLREAERPPRK